jgi:predicted Ser/Thr protein kinase
MGHASVDGLETTLDVGPKDARLSDASPDGTDLVARLARAELESRLFGGVAAPVQVGRYRVEHEIGTGGMGVVYRARDPELERDVALKLLNPRATHVRDPEVARGRLVREARAMARLSHPNVLAVHEVGEFEDQVYVAMEFVDGRTLADWLRTEPRTWQEILDVFLEAGRGLAAAHDEGIVHRDFKPENVMISDKGRVLVLDFGLARPATEPEPEPASTSSRSSGVTTTDIDGADTSLTRTGALVGTPAYMAPEQYAGLGASERSDQFSYCVALWEALHRMRPFAGKTLAALADAVTSGRLEPVGSDSTSPVWIRGVLAQGLAPDPADRHASMQDLLRALIDGRRRAASRVRMLGLGAASIVLVLAGAATTVALVARDAPQSPAPSASRQELVVTPREPVPSVPVPEVRSAVKETTGHSLAEPDVTGPEPEPEPEPEPRPRKRAGPAYAHAYCYYEEDFYRDLTPREGRRKLSPRIQAKGKCWACELRGDTERVRSKVARTDCRHYAACRETACDE